MTDVTVRRTRSPCFSFRSHRPFYSFRRITCVMTAQATPIIILTGYLGAGKTTLLQRLLDETDKRLAVIMNEFGELSVDGTIIKGKDVDIVELSGGCVCCSMTGEFEAAVREIIAKAAPDLIVIETTGVAEPDALVDDITQN